MFVLGLDDSRFGGLSTMLIAMDLFPTPGEIYPCVIREEQRLASVRIREQRQEVVGFATHGDQSSLTSLRQEIRVEDDQTPLSLSLGP